MTTFWKRLETGMALAIGAWFAAWSASLFRPGHQWRGVLAFLFAMAIFWGLVDEIYRFVLDGLMAASSGRMPDWYLARLKRRS